MVNHGVRSDTTKADVRYTAQQWELISFFRLKKSERRLLDEPIRYYPVKVILTAMKGDRAMLVFKCDLRVYTIFSQAPSFAGLERNNGRRRLEKNGKDNGRRGVVCCWLDLGQEDGSHKASPLGMPWATWWNLQPGRCHVLVVVISREYKGSTRLSAGILPCHLSRSQSPPKSK
jgi:hypothetical protein